MKPPSIMPPNDTDQLIALVHACGLEAGADPSRSRTDCPFCNDRIELCRAWLAGFAIGRATLTRSDDGEQL